MIEEKIKELGFILPSAPVPLAAYIPAKKAGNLIFTAGQLPFVEGKLQYTGRLGKEVSMETGRKAAEICVLNCLSVVKAVIGDLDKIEGILKLTVFVNSSNDFADQAQVANGASELLVKIFGEPGKHARSAIGVNVLPLNTPVEIEMVAQIK